MLGDLLVDLPLELAEPGSSDTNARYWTNAVPVTHVNSAEAKLFHLIETCVLLQCEMFSPSQEITMFKGSEIAGTMTPVQISTVTGDNLRGYIKGGFTGKLLDFLNRESDFFEFIGADGQAIILSKSAVRSLALIELPRTDQLSRRMKLQNRLDPYSILGVAPGTSAEEVRNAYRHRARLYHPDNLAGAEVPAEVLEYVSAMFMRLTEAYREICKPADFGEAA